MQQRDKEVHLGPQEGGDLHSYGFLVDPADVENNLSEALQNKTQIINNKKISIASRGGFRPF